MAGHNHELVDHIGISSLLCLALEETLSVLAIERSLHVYAIEPHLVWVGFLVPEATLGNTWVRLQLGIERVKSLTETWFWPFVVGEHQHLACIDMVERVVGELVALDAAIGIYKCLHNDRRMDQPQQRAQDTAVP